jgi:EmrB/QacA subfamily drug resistance transporter
VLATSILASSLAFVDGSVVNVALPAIGRAFSARADALQWCINAYLVPLSALLLLGGAAGDRFGRRRLLLLGTILFGLASLACAVAPTLATLLAARFVQGVGAAMVMPSSLAILGQTFSGPAKGRAVGIWAAASGIAAAVGPVLGGWLVDLGSWRAIFLINLPIAAAAILLTFLYVSDEQEPHAGALDVQGGALITAGLGALIWTLTVASGPRGWTRSAALTGLGSIALIGAFAVVEKQRQSRALIPLALLASRSLMALNLVTLLLYGALGALLVLVPYVLIEAQQYSGSQAGAALLPFPVVMVAISPFAGAFSERAGARMPIAAGSIAVGVGMLLTLRLHPMASYWSGLFPALVVMSIGMSFAVAPLTSAVLGQVEARYSGAAAGLNSAIARTGGLVATALVGVVFAAHGEALLRSFHATMAIGALVCCGAFIIALTLPGSAEARSKPAVQ